MFSLCSCLCKLHSFDRKFRIPKLYSNVTKLHAAVRDSRRASSSVDQTTCSSADEENYDVVVVGGGIVGMATARTLAMQHPNLQMAVVEKERKLAVHQSGHNSGVIHAGIYYKPGSLKARLCVEGLKKMYEYCDEHNIPYKKCGKLIVATNEGEKERLNELYKKGLANKVPDLQLIDAEKMKEIEPYCKGLKAVWSPHTGIVDYVQVTEEFCKDFEECGGKVHLNFKVTAIEGHDDSAEEFPVQVRGEHQSVRARYVLTCGGLHSDVLAQMTGCNQSPRIIPFRGEYLLLNPEKTHLIKGNIYPVPDPRFPFLGVHFTPRMDGSVWLGPNAILAFRREGYRWTDLDMRELLDVLKYQGFQRLSAKHLKFGLHEILKSAILRLQVKDIQKFIPQITVKDLIRGPAGVRAQAVADSGDMVDDFVFDSGTTKRVLHCRNAPSPAATASLAIAEMIADKVQTEFQLNC